MFDLHTDLHCYQEQSADSKMEMRSRKSKDKHYNDQQKNDKHYNDQQKNDEQTTNGRENTAEKTYD